MEDTHKVFMRPVWVGGKKGYLYDIEYDGEVVAERRNGPLGDAARWLKSQGKTGPVELWRHGTKFPAMTGDIETLAKRTVRESETKSPTFGKWEPYPTNIHERES
jgi:hypothetical protein